MDSRVKGMYALDEVNSNAGQDATAREEAEQEHQNGGTRYSPYGGEQKVASPVTDGTGKLVVVLVEHRNEPCRYRQLYKPVNRSSGCVKGGIVLASIILKTIRRPKVTASLLVSHRSLN